MSAAAEIQPMFFDEEGGNDLEIQFDPKQFEAVTPYSENLEDEYQQAQDQLRQLRQQEEQIRRQAAELEELTQKEEQFKEGRNAITEQIQHYLSVLDREATEARRIAEECAAAHERLEGHLAGLGALNPETWTRSDRKAELTRALGSIDSAEEELEKITPLVEGAGGKKGFWKLGALFAGSAPESFPRSDFLYWVKSGLAFTLPLVGFALVGLIVLLML